MYINQFVLSTAYYSFSRHGVSATNISTVYAVCGNENLCTLNSTATNAELPIAISWKSLSSYTNCVVNFVEIIHDCMPRRVDLNLTFTSHVTQNQLYLRVRNITAHMHVATVQYVHA